MLGPGTNFCLLGHMTGLLFRDYVKLFQRAIFNCVHCWSKMLCVELYIEQQKRYLGVESFWWDCSRTLFLSSKESTNPQTRRFGVQETCTELCATLGNWTTVSLQTIFLELLRVITLPAVQQSARFLAVCGKKKWKVWKIRAVSKIKFLQGQLKKCAFARFIHSDIRPNFISERLRKMFLLTGQCCIWSCELCFVKCFVSICEFKFYEKILFIFWTSTLRDWEYKADDWQRRYN